MKDFWSCGCSLTSIQIILSGDSLCLAWKANSRDCQIELQEVNIELTIRAIDKGREEFPRCDDGFSQALLIANRVR